MDPDEYFYKLLTIEPVYETEDRFFEPFWIFMYRYQSLQRHWELNKDFVRQHIETLQNLRGDKFAEFDFETAYSETAGVDVEYFPEYLRATTLSLALALVENLLISLSQEVAEDLGTKVKLESTRLPYITKYILWLTKGCGIDINIDKELWQSLEVIRKVRNKFVHQIDKDLPEEVRRVMSEMVSEIAENERSITNEFVDISLEKLAKLVKTIELAYIGFYEKTIDD